MKLSFIFELLLIFVFLAFAASRVIDSKGHHLHRPRKVAAHKVNKVPNKNRQTNQNQTNRYCSCSAQLCNCCRDFNIPVVSLQGPGCASLQYLNGDKLAISMSFGERVLTNTTISGRRPKPICMPLPGGVSKFCGRVYNIRRQGDDFNACLGLELRALNDIEASLRVSCFKFGSDGLKVQPAQPLPAVEEDNEEDDEEDDDDDYDDEDDFEFDDDEDDDEDEEDNDVEAAEYESFGLLDDDFIDGLFVGETEGDADEVTPKPVKKTTTKAPPKRRVVTRKPLRRKVTPKATRSTTAKPKVTTTKKPVLQVTEKKPAFVPVSILPNPVETSSIKAETSSTKPETSSTTPSIKTEATTPTVIVQPIIQMIKIPEPINITTGEIAQTSNDISNEIPVDVKINKTEKVTSYEATESTSTAAEGTTVKVEATTEEEYEEENDEPEQSYIIKSEEEDESEEDPLTSMVEDVLDDEDGVKSNLTKVETLKTPGNDTDKKEPKDVVDDVIDGVADIVSDDDSDENSKEDDKKEEEDDDDDIFDDDDDEEDSEEDEEDARAGKSRQSKDMRS